MCSLMSRVMQTRDFFFSSVSREIVEFMLESLLGVLADAVWSKYILTGKTQWQS